MSDDSKFFNCVENLAISDATYRIYATELPAFIDLCCEYGVDDARMRADDKLANSRLLNNDGRNCRHGVIVCSSILHIPANDVKRLSQVIELARPMAVTVGPVIKQGTRETAPVCLTAGIRRCLCPDLTLGLCPLCWGRGIMATEQDVRFIMDSCAGFNLAALEQAGFYVYGG